MAAMTNEQFLDAKLALDAQLELGVITEVEYRDTLLGYMDNWAQGGASVALAAYKGSQAITGLNLFLQEAIDWYAGPADGGPSNDGLYPLTDSVGNTYLVASPAKISQIGEDVVDAAIASAEATLADMVATATAAAATATTKAGESSTSADQALNYRNTTQTLHDETAALAASINDSTYYTTEAAGRAAVADGAYFKVINGTDGINIHKRIDAATVTTPTVIMPSTTKIGTMVLAHPCTAGGSATAIALTPAAGHTVALGHLLVFTSLATTSSDGPVTISCPGIFSGAAANLILPGTVINTTLPNRIWATGGTVMVRPIVLGGTNYYELVAPAFQQQQGTLRFTQSNSSGDAFEGTLMPGTKYPTDLMGVDLEIRFTADASAAGKTFKFAAWSSTAYVIYDFDGVTAVPAGRWRAGESVTIQRLVSGNFKVVRVGARPANDAEALAGTSVGVWCNPKAMATYWGGQKSLVARPMWALDWTLPSDVKPVKITRIEQDRIIIDVRPQDSAYRDGYTRRYDDIIRYEMINLNGKYNGTLTVPHLWSLVSVWTRFGGVWKPWSNYSFNNTMGATTDTGQVHTVFEPVFFLGKQSQTPAEIMAGNGSGPAHGNMDCTGCVIVVTGASKLGTPIADGTSIRDSLGVFEQINAASVSFQQIWAYKSPGASPITVLTANVSHTFTPSTGVNKQLMMLWNGTFTSAEPVGVVVGYSNLHGQRLANRVSARSITDVVTTHTIGGGGGGSVDLGQAKRLYYYTDGDVSNGLQLEIAYVPFRRNGAAAAWVGNVITVNNPPGPKTYWPSHVGGSDFELETGNTLDCAWYLEGVRANAA